MRETRSVKWLICGAVLIFIGVVTCLVLYLTQNKTLTPPTKKLEEVTPLMYEITKEGSNNKIYLFGSVHVANISDIEFPKYLTDAYENSDYLACEFDIVKFLEEIDQQELVKDYIYQDGTTLKDHLSKDVYDKVVKFIKDNYGYGEETTQMLNTIYIESLITQYLAKEAKINTNEGVDTYFLNKAHKEKKNILEVESYELQSNMEKSFPDRYYELSLIDFFNDPDKQVDDLKKLYELWKKGDEKEITELVLQEVDESKYTEEDLEILKDANYKMLDERNIGMKNKLEEYFNSNKKVLFMVGTAHLVGDNGIANLLKQDGYTVKVIK